MFIVNRAKYINLKLYLIGHNFDGIFLSIKKYNLTTVIVMIEILDNNNYN